MASRGVLPILLALSLLAGCIGGEGETPAAVDANDTLDTAATCAGSCETLVAFEETNITEEGAGGVDHHHDYWSGRERITIFTQEAMMSPLATYNAADYEAEAAFTPPQGTFVYEGTQGVDFTISNPRRHACEGEVSLGGYFVCTDNLQNHSAPANAPAAPDPQPPAGLKLRYKHASTINWIDAGELAWGAPLSIKITHPTQTDMPHATSSAWEFQVVSPNAADATLVFDAKADIVRGPGEIELWPGHPDFYAEKDWRLVLDADVTACDTNTCQLPGYEEAGPVSSQKLISYGTRTLYVWVNITEVFAPNPALAPDNWFLYHWNSTSRTNVTDVFDTEGHGAAQTAHAWVLPVDDNGMDSPYADGSKWRFQLGGAFYKAGLSCYGGCADWGAKYHITVIATNQALALDEYDMYCLRDDYCPTPEDAATKA